MKERLELLIGKDARKLTIGTMHSVALNLIKRYAEQSGLFSYKNVSVYGEFEESFLIKNEALNLGYFDKGKWKKAKLKDIENELLGVYSAMKTESETASGTIVKGLRVALKENNALTHGEILLRFLESLPEMAPFLNFKHIMCDEVQDNDLTQREVILKLAELCNASVFVVGDISQCIFGWRGASPESMIQDSQSFEVHTLPFNYRSDPDITDAANKLISNNKLKLPVEIEAARPSDRNNGVAHLKCMDSMAVAGTIKHHIDNNDLKPEDVAILGRNHYLLAKISKCLTELGVEHTYLGKKSSEFKTEWFCSVNAMLRLAANPLDNFAFAVSRPYLGVNDDQYRAIRDKAAKEYISHSAAYQALGFGFVDVGSLFSFSEMVETAHGNFAVKSTKGIYEADTAKALALEWLENNQKYKDVPFSESGPAYLEWLSFFEIADEKKPESKGVQVMTIHGSKGLEFPVVFVVGMNEGILPHKNSYTESELEAERRLAYVAVTRAKNMLFLCVRPERKEDENGKITENPESRFIGEMFI
jgi:DNA helicase-2/ATP-dependent DNA helicase PcrA